MKIWKRAWRNLTERLATRLWIWLNKRWDEDEAVPYEKVRQELGLDDGDETAIYYVPEGKTLTITFSLEDYYADWESDHITLYRNQKTSNIVGVEISGIELKHLLSLVGQVLNIGD